MSAAARFSLGALNVLGIAWVSVHAFVAAVTPAPNVVPFLVAAVPFFAGTRALARASVRSGTALTLGGALLMIGADVFMGVVYPLAR